MDNIKQIHIYDIDGTVVDSLHRYRTIVKPCGGLAIDFPFWVINRVLASNDKLLPLAKQYQNQRRNPEIFVVAATARCMIHTETAHIANVLGWPDYMISRKHGDERSGSVLKIEGLHKMFAAFPELQNVKKRFFYEDNQDYLTAVSESHNLTGIFVPSKQGY
jgi:hypothetical protein